MNTLKRIGRTILQLVKQVCFLPRAVAEAAEQKRRRVVQHELEAERLDRLRNPSNYIAK